MAAERLRKRQLIVKGMVARRANDLVTAPGLRLLMPRPKRTIGKDPPRLHYIPEWAELRGVSQADIGRELDVEKSSVSRWFAGRVPVDKHLRALAALLKIEPAALFRHPDDDWLISVLEGRDPEERRRIKATIETAFPRRDP
jgi:hypothetical protein